MKITRRKHQRKAIWFKAGACFIAGILTIGAVYFYASQSSSAPQSTPKVAQTAPEESTPKFAKLSETPARLKIGKINVDAPIIPVGLTKDGDMDAPNNVTDIGWYNKSAKAGEGKYSVLLDGHHGVNERAVFERLNEVAVGDTISLITSQGTILSYIVRETETRPHQEVDMKKALLPYKKSVQSMTIITCEGTYSNTKKTYDNRTVVYAERVK